MASVSNYSASQDNGGDCWMAAPLFLRLFVRETNGSLSGGFPGIWGVEEQSWRWNILSKGNLYPPLPYPATTTKLTRLWKKKKKLAKNLYFGFILSTFLNWINLQISSLLQTHVVQIVRPVAAIPKTCKIFWTFLKTQQKQAGKAAVNWCWHFFSCLLGPHQSLENI